MITGKFYGVGVGPGDPNLLTIRAVKVLNSVDYVALPKSKMDRESIAWEIAKEHCSNDIKLLELEMPMTSDQQILHQAWQAASESIFAKLSQNKSVAFITLGDPSIYSTYSYLLNYLKEKLSDDQIETVPGISAMSAAAARINMPLTIGDEPLVVLPSAEGVEKYLEFPNLVLLKVSRRLPELLNVLESKKRQTILLSRLGQSNEKIYWNPRGNELQEKVDYLSLLLVKAKQQEDQ